MKTRIPNNFIVCFEWNKMKIQVRSQNGLSCSCLTMAKNLKDFKLFSLQHSLEKYCEKSGNTLNFSVINQTEILNKDSSVEFSFHLKYSLKTLEIVFVWFEIAVATLAT